MVSEDEWRRRMRMRMGMNYPSTSASGKHFAALWVVSAGSLVCIIACWKWVWKAWYEATAHLICVWNELLTHVCLHIFPCDPYLNHFLRYQWSNPASERSERSSGSWSWFQETPRTVFLWNPWNSMHPARSFHLKCLQPSEQWSMLHSHKHGLPDRWPWFLHTLALWPCCQSCCLLSSLRDQSLSSFFPSLF